MIISSSTSPKRPLSGDLRQKYTHLISIRGRVKKIKKYLSSFKKRPPLPLGHAPSVPKDEYLTYINTHHSAMVDTLIEFKRNRLRYLKMCLSGLEYTSAESKSTSFLKECNAKFKESEIKTVENKNEMFAMVSEYLRPEAEIWANVGAELNSDPLICYKLWFNSTYFDTEEQCDSKTMIELYNKEYSWLEISLLCHSPPETVIRTVVKELAEIRPRSRKKWRAEEDRLLKECIEELGERWCIISQRMGDRSPQQCRDRYINYLRPSLNTKEWSSEEDRELKELIEKYGNRWTKISKILVGRSDKQCRVRARKL